MCTHFNVQSICFKMMSELQKLFPYQNICKYLCHDFVMVVCLCYYTEGPENVYTLQCTKYLLK
jgi:hypothetical protein